MIREYIIRLMLAISRECKAESAVEVGMLPERDDLSWCGAMHDLPLRSGKEGLHM
jgi:hypothetical protein